MNYNCSIFWDLRNLQEQVKKAFCYQKLFWPFTVWINCSRDLKNFANSRPSPSNFKSFFFITWTIFLTVSQNKFGKVHVIFVAYLENMNFNKIPLINSNFWPHCEVVAALNTADKRHTIWHVLGNVVVMTLLRPEVIDSVFIVNNFAACGKTRLKIFFSP